jgi:molecular chaperone DnaJ
MQQENYYDILGVSKDASYDDIRAAYRKAAKQYHPDLNNGDKKSEEKFKQVAEAYECLSDPEKRQQYDSPVRDFSFGDINSGFNINDLFSNIMNNFSTRGFSTQGRMERGEDVIEQIAIDLEDLAKDISKQIVYERSKTCLSCNGTKLKSGTKESDIHKCKKCHGMGSVTMTNRRNHFVIRQVVPCPDCGGRGKIIKDEDKCLNCKGEGKETIIETFDFHIAAGHRHVGKFHIQGKGHCGATDDLSGDLIIFVQLKEHPLFKLIDNDNLLVDIQISFAEAALGCDISVPTIYGEILTIKLSPGTQSNTIIIKKGYGVPHGTHRKTDLVVRVVVETPIKLEKDDKVLFEQLSQKGFKGREKIEQYIGSLKT